MSKRVTLGEYLASLPIQLGYELDDHVVAIPLRAGEPSLVSSLQWDESAAPGRDLAETFAAEVLSVARANDLGTQFLLVGYGPAGTQRVQQVTDALLATADLPTPVVAHVEDGQWRQRRAGQEWSDPSPLPDVRAAAVANGEALPAASRSELGSRYEPGTVLYEAGAPQGFIWQAHPPSFRATIVTRNLDQLAQPGHPHDPDRMAMVAHLMITDPIVRDAGIVAAMNDPARTDALVRVFQASPLEWRSTLATATATALFLNGESSVAAQAVLKHAARTGPSAPLTEMVKLGIDTGMNPQLLRELVDTSTQRDLGEADKRWEELRQHQVGDSQPAPAIQRRTPEPAPGTNETALAGRRRPDPGEVAEWMRQHAASGPNQSGPTIR